MNDQLLHAHTPLAIAQDQEVFATDEQAVLILDDVLVNTDPVRQDRILDVLGTQADRLQILILTCHPDRHPGVDYLSATGALAAFLGREVSIAAAEVRELVVRLQSFGTRLFRTLETKT